MSLVHREAHVSPQLPDSRYLVRGIDLSMLRCDVSTFILNLGLSGILHTEDIEGACKAGTMARGGFPYLFWYTDPVAGNCAIYASQFLLSGNELLMELSLASRRAVLKSIPAKL